MTIIPKRLFESRFYMFRLFLYSRSLFAYIRIFLYTYDTSSCLNLYDDNLKKDIPLFLDVSPLYLYVSPLFIHIQYDSIHVHVFICWTISWKRIVRLLLYDTSLFVRYASFCICRSLLVYVFLIMYICNTWFAWRWFSISRISFVKICEKTRVSFCLFRLFLYI